MLNNEVGKETIPQGTKTHTVNFVETYEQPPVVKISSIQNTNVYITEVTNSYFKLNKNINEEVNIHYIVIESE